MPTLFPTALDDLNNPAGGDSQTEVSHSEQHANANDAIEALQRKVGIDNSADTDSLDYLVRTGIAQSFRQAFTGAAVRTNANKLLDFYPTIKDAGAAADGETDDTDAVSLLEASSFGYVDLQGLTVKTTLLASALDKNYYNGTLLVENANGNVEQLKPVAPTPDYAIQRPRTKSPILDWQDLSVLWLGTSIPHQGVGVDGYPELFAATVGCSVTNMAWSGSRAAYDVEGDPFDITTVKSLSMTEDDRQAGLAAYGPTSAYDDAFDLITNASEMTCDYRIREQFATTPFSVVVLDHNHNDRRADKGTLAPETLTITAVATGATTELTLASLGTIMVGDAVALSVVGIGKLNYAAARVQAINIVDRKITLNIDSSGYLGSFTSGTAAKLDRATLFGAFEFLINTIYNAALVNDAELPKIVLCGAPSEYTNDVADNSIFANARAIKELADKWGLAFFDIGHLYDVKHAEHPIYFPDNVHPTTRATRQAIANHWVQWAMGGAPTLPTVNSTLMRGGTSDLTDQREAMYSRFTGGFSTPKFIVGEPATLLNEPFASLASWTENEVSGGVVNLVAAPWGAGNAVECITSGSPQNAYISNAALAFVDGFNAVEFDLYLPAVSGLTATSSPKTVNIMHVRAAGSYMVLSLIVRPASVALSMQYFKESNVDLVSLQMASPKLSAATKHRVRIESVKATAAYKGGMLVFLDGVLVSSVIETEDSLQPTPTTLRLGIVSTNTGAALTAYFGNLLLETADALDYTSRFSGTFTTADAKTVTVVNGIIVSAV